MMEKRFIRLLRGWRRCPFRRPTCQRWWRWYCLWRCCSPFLTSSFASTLSSSLQRCRSLHPVVNVIKGLQSQITVNFTIVTMFIVQAGNTKGISITVPLTSCVTVLESPVWILTIFVFICKTDQSKPVKQEVNGIVIPPPLVFPGTG